MKLNILHIARFVRAIAELTDFPTNWDFAKVMLRSAFHQFVFTKAKSRLFQEKGASVMSFSRIVICNVSIVRMSISRGMIPEFYLIPFHTQN